MKTTGEDLQAKLAELKADYAQSLPIKISEIKACAETFIFETADDRVFCALKDLNARSHTLAGSAGTFGFKNLSVATQKMETLTASIISDKPPFNDILKAEVSRLLGKIEEIAQLDNGST